MVSDSLTNYIQKNGSKPINMGIITLIILGYFVLVYMMIDLFKLILMCIVR